MANTAHVWRSPIPSRWGISPPSSPGARKHALKELYSPHPPTPCMTVHVYTSVCKLDAGVHGYTKNKT